MNVGRTGRSSAGNDIAQLVFRIDKTVALVVEGKVVDATVETGDIPARNALKRVTLIFVD